LYFSDYGTNRVLKFDFRTKQTSVVAGTGTKGHAGDGEPALSAQIAAPHEVRFDSNGNLYIDERDNHTIRKVEMASSRPSPEPLTRMDTRVAEDRRRAPC
jgi:hypothetical protein